MQKPWLNFPDMGLKSKYGLIKCGGQISARYPHYFMFIWDLYKKLCKKFQEGAYKFSYILFQNLILPFFYLFLFQLYFLHIQLVTQKILYCGVWIACGCPNCGNASLTLSWGSKSGRQKNNKKIQNVGPSVVLSRLINFMNFNQLKLKGILSSLALYPYMMKHRHRIILVSLNLSPNLSFSWG